MREQAVDVADPHQHGTMESEKRKGRISEKEMLGGVGEEWEGVKAWDTFENRSEGEEGSWFEAQEC